jgi:hypothetical protein
MKLKLKMSIFNCMYLRQTHAQESSKGGFKIIYVKLKVNKKNTRLDIHDQKYKDRKLINV